ncbi:MAG TPA: Rieske 2Fe-2S domain-containing protein [Candidatus Nitrosocosmicus sp.]|nr:Rieske 2Fe-2S domain-containing protein [Candidatus Nitrosocosmicus sp.]
MTWINVCKVDVSDNEKLVAFDYKDRKILVTKILDKIYSTDRICTHGYSDLSTGFLNEEEKTITCPLHFSRFGLETGISQNPPANIPLKTYDNKLEVNCVYVFIN